VQVPQSLPIEANGRNTLTSASADSPMRRLSFICSICFGATSLVAVEVQEGTSLKQLQEALDEFLRSLSKSSPKQSSE
jgi:hypothetical protein